MITGAVKADEGRIRLSVKGLRGRAHQVDAVIDCLRTVVGRVPAIGPRCGLRSSRELSPLLLCETIPGVVFEGLREINWPTMFDFVWVRVLSPLTANR
jgi:hypothetical protein